jgi:purine-binding chemotaxis protein CheW
MTTQRLCTFVVDDLVLGVEIDDVLEVLRNSAVTPVPLAPASVAGLLNLRGRIVTAVDARRRLDLPPSAGASVNVVIRSGDEAVGLLVDREGEVLDVDDSMAIPLPPSVSPTVRSFTTCSYLVDDETVLVLDPDKTLTVASS